MQRKSFRTMLVGAVGCAMLAAALAPLTQAHPRPYRHGHRQHHAKAVIVVGQPKPVKRAVVIDGRAHGVLDMNVKPKATKVFVDGRLRGTCGVLDGSPGKLHLLPGVHRIKLVTPDGLQVERDVRVKAGVEIDVGLDLRS